MFQRLKEWWHCSKNWKVKHARSVPFDENTLICPRCGGNKHDRRVWKAKVAK